MTYSPPGKDCGSTIPGLPTFAAETTCDQSLFGDTCEATCQPGYEGGPETFTCGTEGEWEGSLNCVGVDCGRAIPGLSEDATDRCRGDTSFGGDDCQAACAPVLVAVL